MPRVNDTFKRTLQRIWSTPSGVFDSETSYSVKTSSSGSDFKDWKIYVSRLQDAGTQNYSTTWYSDEPALLRDMFSRRWILPSGKPTTNVFGGQRAYVGYTGMPSTPSDDGLRDLALKRIKAKLNSERAQVNAMVPLAEIGEMRGLIRQSAALTTNLVRTLLDLKRGNFRDAHRRASDIWLGFSFGITPVLSDTKAISENIAAFFEAPDHPFRAKGTASKRWITSSEFKNVSLSDISYINGTATFSHELTYSYSGGAKIAPRTANDYNLFSSLGFVPENLLSTVWELVPYSWIVDYFTTAGDFMEDMFHDPGGDTYYLHLSKKYERKMSCDMHSSCTHYQVLAYNPAHGISSQSAGSFTRTRLSQLPRRSLRFKSIDEIGVNSIKRLLNLASLLRF